jgi:hypothetical protein
MSADPRADLLARCDYLIGAYGPDAVLVVNFSDAWRLNLRTLFRGSVACGLPDGSVLKLIVIPAAQAAEKIRAETPT